MARYGTVADAAAEASAAESTVRRWIRDGVIAAERIGAKRWRVDLDSLATRAPLPADPRREALARALAQIDDRDMLALRALAHRLDDALKDAIPFHVVWGSIGAVAYTEARREARHAA